MTRWIVVGGGAAGSVVAARLSADESAEVLLLEAGADHGAQPAAGDRGPFLDDPARLVSHSVRRRPGRRAEPYVLGSGLGGSSLVNGSIVVPGGPGTDGNHAIPLERPTAIGAVGSALLAADGRAEPLLLATRDGSRVTAADAYLRPVLDRANLIVSTGAHVERIIVEGRRAIGVRTADGRTFHGDRVVLAAGTIGTSLVLLRSGVDAPGVGEHLQDHPAIAVTVAFDRPSDDLGAHDITVATEATDHQIVALERTTAEATHGALIVGLTNTTSRGSIALDPHGSPVISLGQLETSDDRERMAAAVLDLVDVLDHPATRALGADRFVDDIGTRLDDLGRDASSVSAWMLDHLGGFHHVAGTCRRGEVTDDDGWVRGVEHLAVADASLFVDLPRTNVYLSTILQAEELAGRWSAAAG